MSENDLLKRIEELEKRIAELEEMDKKERKAIKDIAKILDDHLKGKWNLEDIRIALEHINEMVQLLTQSGIIRPGEGSTTNWLQMLLAQQFVASKQQQEEVEVEPIKKKSKKKLKKMLEEGEEE